MRYLNEKTMYDKDGRISDAYKLVKFYLRTHFNIKDITPDEYIWAMISKKPEDVSLLINACLRYKPVEPYDAVKDYEKIAPALLSA